MFSNIMQHPKTSIAGVLIGVSAAAGVLSQQGITLGHAGTGTVVALIASLATVFLGLISRDPETVADTSRAAGSTQKIGAVMLCVLLLTSLMASGCTQAQKVNVAQEIVNWTPTIQSAVDTIAATGALLDPAAAPVFAIATAGVDVLAAGFASAAKTYLANPTQTNLQLVQSLIVQFQQKVNVGLLETAKIANPQSQKTALAVINGLAVAVNAVLALVQSISTKAQVQAMAAHVTVTYAMVRQYLDNGAMAEAAARVRGDMKLPRAVSTQSFFSYESAQGF